MKQKSTLSNLLEFVQRTSTTLDDGGSMDVIYMDMTKAFDRVPHERLLKKIDMYGCSNAVTNLLKSYLVGRQYQVNFCGFTSKRIVSKSGVGQGSVLGPLLFIIYINDLLTKLDCDFEVYVDDVKLFKRINGSDDQQQLQLEINKTYEWCKDNGLHMNASKCCVLTVTKKLNYLKGDYYADNVLLNRTEQTKDLGVIVDSRLKFDIHIENTVKRANRMLGFVMRVCRQFRKLHSILALYNTLVRPILEYCSPVWSPIYAIHSEKIENVQHRFTRYVFKKFHYPYESYEQRLLRLQMNSLSDRRTQTDLVTLSKIVHQHLTCDLIEDLQLKYVTHGLRSVNQFQLPIPRTNILKAAPLNRFCSILEDEFSDMDIFLPPPIFKRQLKSKINPST